MKINLLISFLVLLSVQKTVAQTQFSVAETPFSDTLAEVVITAQRCETVLANTPASVTKLPQRKLLERQERTAPEALMSLPGVFVQKTNHGGGSPFLRGLTGNQTLFLVDGIRLSNATFRYGPNQYLNTVDPFTIANIEVLKGGGSVGFGSDALGGTINVLTQMPEFQGNVIHLERSNKYSGEAIALWRSHDMENTAHLKGNFSSKKMAIHLAGSLRKFGDLAGGDTTGVQSPTGYEEAALDLKGKARLGKNAVLILAHQFFQQDDVPVYHKIQLENFARNHIVLQQRQLSYARFEFTPDKMPGLHKITATFSFQQSDEHRESQKNGSAILRKEADEVNSLGASVQAEAWISTAWHSIVGTEIYHDLVGSYRSDEDTGTGNTTEKRGLYPDGATHTSAAVFWLNNWKSGSWNLTGGVRYNYFSIRVEDETIGEAHLNPGTLVWNTGVLRNFNRRNIAFFSFNTAFRAPNVDDLGSLGIVDFRYELPTTDLKPEKSYNFELGWRYRPERWQAEVAVFRNELRDLIARVRVGTDSIAGYPVYRKENVQQGYIQGVDINGKVLIANDLYLEGAVAAQYGQNVTDDEPLRRIPPLFGRLGLHFSKKDWQITLEHLFAGKQERLAKGDRSDNRIPVGGTPGWQIVNIYGHWHWKWLLLRAGFWNILNADYRYHGSGVNGPGRSVSVGAAVEF
jgi:outer membrane receptor protein involved in Fe transport